MKKILISLLFLGFFQSASSQDPQTESLYKDNCAICHGVSRLGITGPALLPENLKRLRKKQAVKTITNGRVATQMPSFKDKLSKEQITLLSDYIYTPLSESPVWNEEKIKTSHITYPQENLKNPDDANKPAYNSDPLNLFLVVETGDHHVSVLDGDSFEVIYRFASRFALHGGPKYSADGRFVYLASRDGWITKFDMYRLRITHEVRVGINTRNAAVSSDGRFVLVGNYLPNNLVVLDAKDLSLIKIIPTTNAKGKSSRVSAVYDAHPRQSFVVALKDIPEVWEISYKNPTPLGFGKWVHDHRPQQSEAEREILPIRKIKIDSVLDDFFFNQEYTLIVGSSRGGLGRIVDLDLGRIVSKLNLSGMPHLSSGITWKYKDTEVLATPNLKDKSISIFDMKDWGLIKKIKTLGSGFFLRSHENSRYAWTDVFFGKDKDVMHIIDKQTLQIVKTLRPSPGKTSSHVEFTKDGSHALVSIWEMDGELVIYNAHSLKEFKRLPMKRPVGKYNVYNKINRSSGTSH